MQLIRFFAGPLLLLVAFIALTALGLITGGAGWVALSILCAWPLFFAVTGWTARGLKDSYSLVRKGYSTKETRQGQRTERLSRNQPVPESPEVWS